MTYPWPWEYVVGYLLAWLGGALVHYALMAVAVVPWVVYWRVVGGR